MLSVEAPTSPVPGSKKEPPERMCGSQTAVGKSNVNDSNPASVVGSVFGVEWDFDVESLLVPACSILELALS